jgi:hypothetical protein
MDAKTPLVILAVVVALAVILTLVMRYFGFNPNGYSQ